MSEALIEQELEPILDESLSRYMGTHVPHIGEHWDILINEFYPIIQTQLPAIFFRVPRSFLKPRQKTYITKKRNPTTGKKEDMQVDASQSAKTQEAILNYDIEQMKYKPEMRKVMLDALLAPYAVMWHGYKGDFGMTEEESIVIRDGKVFVKRISPLRFIYDPNVSISNINDAKFIARKIDIPMRDLIEDDKLDVDKSLVKGFEGFGNKVGTKKVMAQGGTNGRDEVKPHKLPNSLLDFAEKGFRDSTGARFVTVYEVFLRPTKKEKRQGKKGWILLLTDEQEKPLRVSEWNIKAEGFPAKILQFNELNDTAFGMNDIDTYKQLVDEKNIIINQQIANAAEMGKTWVGISADESDEEDIQAVQEGGNTIVKFKGDGDVRSKMMIATGAGQGSSELYSLDGRIQANLDNTSGVNDLRRGVLQSGEESAFSVRQRAMASSARPSYRQDLVTDFLKESFLYINQLHKQFVPFTEAVRIIGSMDLEWSENPSKEEIQADVDIEIDAISMLPENPEDELKRYTETLQLAVQAIADPIVAQKIAQEGKTVELAPLIEQILMRQKIRNPGVFRNLRPEESQGFVSVQQLREAQANVESAVTSQQLQFPPKEGDDHRAKLEVYMAMQKLLKGQDQINQNLTMLIQAQASLLQAEQDKEAKPGPVNLPKPSVG